MRLISQDGTNDMPYKKTVITVTGNCIYGIYDDSCGCFLGKFDTEEKAVNELKKIRTAYASGRMIYKIGE